MAAAASMKLLAVSLLSAGTCVVAPAWSIVTSPCPSGMRYLTQAEVAQENAAICAQIDDWTVLEVGSHSGPGFTGPGGGACAYDPTGCVNTCTQSLCTPGSEGDGKKMGEGEDIALWAVAVFVCLSLYVGGGIGYKYHTEGEIAHPHMVQFKNIGGLVVDGVAFTKAKAQSQEYTPPPAIDASAAGGAGGGDSEKEPLTKSAGGAPSGYGATKPDIKGGAAPPPRGEKEKKKKKKNKKAKEIEDEDGDAKE